MSEHTEEIRDAAAAGAAAAVDAVVTEQTEQERAEAEAAATVQASTAAEIAEQEANAAAEAATVAATVASEAHAEASEAEATAQEAQATATQASGEIGELREMFAAGFSQLRDFITEKLTSETSSDEPTEVVVTHAPTGQSDSEQEGSDTGGGRSPGEDERAYRHRFGRRRG
jgi:uncharacterized membrane protein YqiK